MNILHILNDSLPHLSGYSIRSQYIAEFQKQIGINPFVITSPKFYEFGKDINTSNVRYQTSNTFSMKCDIISGIPYYRTQTYNGSFNIIPLLQEKILIEKLSKNINKVAKEKNISVIHAHSPFVNGLAGLKACRKLGIPLVYEIRTLWEEAGVVAGKFRSGSMRYKIYRYLENIVLKRADVVVVICENLKETVLKRQIEEDKLFVVPNGVDTNKFIPKEKDEKLCKKYGLSGELVLGFIGSFFKFEGLTVLIQSFAKVCERNRNVKLLLVGDGEDFLEIKQLIETLGLQQAVILTGMLPHDVSIKHYSLVDIFVYPRIRNRLTDSTTPLKPLEAMSMGKTVIASDVGGLRELIKNQENGILFSSEDIEDLADKLLALIKNKDKMYELGQNARNDMIQNRDWSKVISKYRIIYSSDLRKM